MSQPTGTTPLPERPASDPRRPKLMSALALAEHLTALAELPYSLHIEADIAGTEFKVVAYAHRNIETLHAWQRRFGGELHHQICDYPGRRTVKSTLSGRVYDAPFQIWTLRHITPKPTPEELALSGQWMDEHGDPAGWAPETHTAYVDTLAEWLTGGAQ